MRIFLTKAFSRFARREGIEEADLLAAVARAAEGQIDADLGGGVIKQRLARPGEGKSGGFRSIILFRHATTSVFVYGYAKSDRDNIGPDELRAFKRLAAEMLNMSEVSLKAAMKNGTLREIG